MDGLPALRSAGGDLLIQNNPGLRDITGLYGMERVGGDVLIMSNPQLPQSQANELVVRIGEDNIGGEVQSFNNNG